MTRIIEQQHEPMAGRSPKRRIVDLTLPIDRELRGAQIVAATELARDGWNSTTLTLYSHCGTHVDAPCHFVDGGTTLDELPPEVLWGPAKVVKLTPVQPRELLTVEHLGRWADDIAPGDRLLFRTDWYRHVGTDIYRNELPRISIELARWLVSKQVALIGVEPPSVADVNNFVEVTAVHRILFEGGVVIVEGLANLDQLQNLHIELVVLPLRIRGGDGCPARALAREMEH